MAYFENKNQNQQENELGMNNSQQNAPGQPQQNQQQAPQQIAPAADSMGQAAPQPQQAPSQAQPSAAPAKAPSSGMTSFQQFQKANQGTAQNRLGQAVQAGLQKNVGAAQGALDRGQSNFSKLMEQGTLANRQNAVADVTKAATQARNVYTGDLAADKSNLQQNITGLQTQAQTIAQNKEAAQAQIAQRQQQLAANQQKQYTDALAAANAKTDRLKAIYDNKTGVTNNFGDMRQLRNLSAYRTAQRNAENIKKQGMAQFGRDESAAIQQAQQQLGFSDFQKTQLDDQASALQKQLESLNTREFTSGVDADLQQRFADIINARYSGPQSMRETGAYNETLDRVNKAQDLATMSKTAGGREDLLAQLYGRPGSDYTRGMSRLDAALLNTNKDAMTGIQSQAKELGGMRDRLARANVDSQLAGQNRSKEIADIRQQSRSEFTKQQEAEEALTEGRLDEAIASGNEFAQYFKDQLTGKTGTTTLNPYEAALLGVSSGEGLYNMGGDAVKTAQLERGRMISKDEFARQSALANLAKLDQSNELKQALKYGDESLVGTQTAADALDVEGTRAALNAAEQQFRRDAAGADIEGYGKGKASKGNLMGKKTKTARTTLENNVADMLTAAGYDMNSEIGQNVARSILSDEQATSRFLTGVNRQDEVDADGTLGGVVQGGAAGASLGSAGGPVGTAIGAGVGALAGGYIGGGTMSVNQMYTDSLNQLSPGLGDVYNAPARLAGNVVTGAGNVVGGSLGSFLGNVGSSIGGIDSGALAKKAKQKANKAAQADLLKNYQNYLKGQGFSNRIGVSATDKAANERLLGLQQILSRLDKTNVNTTSVNPMNTPNTETQSRNLFSGDLNAPSTNKIAVSSVPTETERAKISVKPMNTNYGKG